MCVYMYIFIYICIYIYVHQYHRAGPRSKCANSKRPYRLTLFRLRGSPEKVCHLWLSRVGYACVCAKGCVLLYRLALFWLRGSPEKI